VDAQLTRLRPPVEGRLTENLATKVPKASWPMIATLVRSIFEQPDRDATWNQLGDVVEKLTQAGFNDIAVVLLDAADDILAFRAFPVEHWPKIRSNNPQERLNKEIRRHTRGRDLPQPGVGDPPGRGAAGRADRRVGHHQALHERRDTQDRPSRRALRPRPTTSHRGRRWMISRRTPTNRITDTAGPTGTIRARPTTTDLIKRRPFPNQPFHDMISNKSIRYNESTQVDEKIVATDASYTTAGDSTFADGTGPRREGTAVSRTQRLVVTRVPTVATRKDHKTKA
jgi:hypothetical protein